MFNEPNSLNIMAGPNSEFFRAFMKDLLLVGASLM
jgi:hypothetical protein